VALSGGKTPVDFYKRLSRDKERPPWEKTHVFLADERFVPFESEESNYGMIKRNLLDPSGVNKENVHFLDAWEENAELSADKYARVIKDFFGLEQGGFPRFDLIMLGIGEDGHIASLFPGDPAVSEEKKLIVDVKPEKAGGNERISLTVPVINSAKNIVFLVTGPEKAAIAEKVLEGSASDLPASMIAPFDGRLFFLLDRESGKYIKS
jgi:6-phosphogluconolactonase